MEEISSFGYWVRRRRKALDLTQTDLANKVYCSLSTIKKIELDERRPSPLMAERLAECLQVEGGDRKLFLAAAGAEIPFDRLPLMDVPFSHLPSGSNLAAFQPSTPFVGYEKELTELSSLITKQGHRLVSLVGLGGIGKTRLALQFAGEQVSRFSDGVYFIPLAQVESSSLVPSAILNALSIPRYSRTDLRTTLLEYLNDRNMLLVLDNFEHLLNAAGLVSDILHCSRGLVIITTSRMPLNLTQERVFEVNGLPVEPDAGVQVSNLDAVQLFLQTAQRVGGGINPSLQELDTILRICRQVSGIPLAIELAAAWVRTYTYAEIEDGIIKSLDFLTSTMRDANERHSSIRAVFEFSWHLLTPKEQDLFPILSIFRGGFHFDAIQEIAKAEMSTLISLVNKSLLSRTASGRYEMHELIRRYSELKLTERGLVDHYRALHLAYYLQLAENSFTPTTLSKGERLLPTYDSENDNFRQALSTAVDQHKAETGLRLAVALGQFWYDSGILLEEMTWLRQVLEQGSGQFPTLEAQALILSAWIALEIGDFEQATRLCKQSLTLCKELKDQHLIGQSLLILGSIHYLEGEFDQGSRLLERSLEIFRTANDEKYQIKALLHVADLEMRRGRLDQADQQWRQALVISIRLNTMKEMGFSLGGLGDTRRLQGKNNEAMEYYKKALLIHWKQNDLVDIPYIFEAMALNYIALQLPGDALFLWGAADKLRHEIHSMPPPSYQRSYAPAIRELRDKLGEESFTKAWQAGYTAPLEQVIKRFFQSLPEDVDQPAFYL